MNPSEVQQQLTIIKSLQEQVNIMQGFMLMQFLLINLLASCLVVIAKRLDI
jgi:hypothetical protein